MNADPSWNDMKKFIIRNRETLSRGILGRRRYKFFPYIYTSRLAEIQFDAANSCVHFIDNKKGRPTIAQIQNAKGSNYKGYWLPYFEGDIIGHGYHIKIYKKVMFGERFANISINKTRKYDVKLSSEQENSLFEIGTPIVHYGKSRSFQIALRIKCKDDLMEIEIAMMIAALICSSAAERMIIPS